MENKFKKDENSFIDDDISKIKKDKKVYKAERISKFDKPKNYLFDFFKKLRGKITLKLLLLLIIFIILAIIFFPLIILIIIIWLLLKWKIKKDLKNAETDFFKNEFKDEKYQKVDASDVKIS